MNKAVEFNYVSPKMKLSDILLFLGPMEDTDGPFKELDPDWKMAHLLHDAGCFPSIKQAKNNGWDIPISPGYQELVVGKRKLRIYILNSF